MKKSIILIVSGLFVLFAQAQINRSVNWPFGIYTGLNFSGSSPSNMPSGLPFVEAVGAISDTSGNLLFYSNGEVVLDAMDSIMPNGSGLLGCNSSTQGALIVPMPQNPDIYYLFTTSCYEQNFNYGLQYHVIDMRLNGGRGDVIRKNELVSVVVAEELAATYHANNCDVWIACHERYTDKYHAYLLTDTGLVTTPVISQVGPMYQPMGNQFGRTSLRFNRSGTLAVQSPRRQLGTNVHRFDRSTGQFSAWLAIPFHPQFNDHYSAAFSPNDSLVYVTGWTQGSSTFNWLLQYDLTRQTAQEIADSATILHFAVASSNIGQIQNAPDGKIYIAHENSPFLGIIHSPNQPGQACSFVFTGQQCTGNTKFGLPNFVSQFTGPGPATGCTPPVGFAQGLNDSRTKLYPNPFEQEAWLEFTEENRLDYELIVVDMLGRMVILERGVQSPYKIERGNLPDGLYTYVLRTGAEVVAKGRMVLR